MKLQTKSKNRVPGFLLLLTGLPIVMFAHPSPAQKAGAARILFIESSQETHQDSIMIMNSDGTGQVKLERPNGNPLAADWSPDGCKILSRIGVRNDGDRSVQASLRLDKADGSDSRALVADVGSGPENGLQNYFSPDGSKVVYISRSNDVMVVNADGSGVKKLTNQLYAFQPSWSPDGSKILFMTNGLPHRIRIMNPDGTNLQDIGGGSDAQWSPDGSKIMFVTNDQNHSDIAVMRPDGKDIKVLTNGAGIVLHPSWSPDGSKIAFQSLLEQSDNVLEVMNADGSEGTRIADHLFVDLEVGQGPSWSPDSSALVFHRLPFSMKEMASQFATNGAQALRIDIYTVGVDGANLKKLSTSGMALNPKWSPTPGCKKVP